MATMQYLVQEGERWDTVSMKAYGTPFKGGDLQKQNPNVPVTDRIKAGTRLQIEVLPEYSVIINKNLLPPWKR